ncbi:hypothetical protein [Nocardia sp. NPDC004123]
MTRGLGRIWWSILHRSCLPGAFNRISEVITTTLGISASQDVTDEMELHWLTPKVVFDLAASGYVVHLKLYDPDYWRFVDEVKQLEAEAYEEDDDNRDED